MCITFPSFELLSLDRSPWQLLASCLWMMNLWFDMRFHAFLSTTPDIEVVGQATTGEEAISSVERLGPHVVVMDIRMPRMDGITATREIKDKYPHVHIIGLSEYAYGYHADAMLKAGAAAVHQKAEATEELYAAIKKVSGGHDSL